jgi:hypothetical protein
MTTTATLEATARQIVAGEEAAVHVEVRNDSDIVEEYRTEIVGPPSAWASAEPAEVTLLPGQNATITVHFRPPRSSAVLAGPYDYGVRVLPTERPENVVVLEGAVDVLPFTETTAELVPWTSHGRFAGRHRIAVDNRGNTPINVALTGLDRGDRLVFRFQPPETTIAPGTAEFAALRVRPIKVMLRGVPVTHPFTITVQPPDVAQPVLEETVLVPGLEKEETELTGGRFAPVNLEGTYLQEPVLPPWFLKALIALVLVAAGLVALWFFVIRSAVVSTAEAAIEDEVAAVDADAQQAAQNADTAQAASVEAAEAAEEAKTDAGIENPAPTRVPFASRLEVTAAPGAPASKQLVPPNTTDPIEITDIVVSNPQGDSGRLSLKLDDVAILDLALENFRDTDYHFLTPIGMQAGQSLVLSVTCVAPGQPPEPTPPPDSCVASALVGGNALVPIKSSEEPAPEG